MYFQKYKTITKFSNCKTIYITPASRTVTENEQR